MTRDCAVRNFSGSFPDRDGRMELCGLSKARPCWPSPPLRPNAPPFGLRRAALRTGQQNRGCCRSRETGIVVPRASWREIFSRKRKALTGKKKNQEPEPKKGDILIEVRKGTF
jgi:hypothetical protein